MNTQELLEILACPRCLGPLEAVPGAAPQDDPGGFLCPACAVIYPIREGIPVMLADEAIPRDQWNAKGA